MNVFVVVNAKNSFGGYTGDMLVVVAFSGGSIEEYPRQNRSRRAREELQDDSTRSSEMPVLRHDVQAQQSQSKVLLVPLSLGQSSETKNA